MGLGSLLGSRIWLIINLRHNQKYKNGWTFFSHFRPISPLLKCGNPSSIKYHIEFIQTVLPKIKNRERNLILVLSCRWLPTTTDRLGYQRIPQIHVPAVCEEDNWKRLHQSRQTGFRVSSWFLKLIHSLQLFVICSPIVENLTLMPVFQIKMFHTTLSL